MENCKIHTWGIQSGHSLEIVPQIVSYLQFQRTDYCDQMDTLLELIYQSYTEFNSVETPECKKL